MRALFALRFFYTLPVSIGERDIIDNGYDAQRGE